MMEDFKRQEREQERIQKELQRKKAATQSQKVVFKGKRQLTRSDKPEFKLQEVKEDTMDQQTRDEKEYLDAELFMILQDVKNNMELG
jgi:hypothetical protein